MPKKQHNFEYAVILGNAGHGDLQLRSLSRKGNPDFKGTVSRTVTQKLDLSRGAIVYIDTFDMDHDPSGVADILEVIEAKARVKLQRDGTIPHDDDLISITGMKTSPGLNHAEAPPHHLKKMKEKLTGGKKTGFELYEKPEDNPGSPDDDEVGESAAAGNEATAVLNVAPSLDKVSKKQQKWSAKQEQQKNGDAERLRHEQDRIRSMLQAADDDKTECLEDL